MTGRLGDLAVLLDHDDFVIVDKPAGLSVHNDRDSVHARLGPSYHLVHRLDKETSGLVMLTRDGKSQERLQKALQDGIKEYVAILRGRVEVPPENTANWPLWKMSISDRAEGRDHPNGQKADWLEAETEYLCEKANAYFSHVRCRLRTGRQHQIRKHAALFGRPIVGDPRYGNPKDNVRIAQMYGFNRLALHAHRLSFQWKGEGLTAISPVPGEFALLFPAADNAG